MLTWTNTAANGSIFVHDGAFHQLNNGWLEKTENGTTWVRVSQPGTIYTRGKSIDGSIYLYGGSSLVILTGYDMGVHLVECEVADYAVGDTVDVTFTLTNEGNTVFPAGDYEVDVFLSLDGFHGNEDDAPMGSASAAVPELLPGESITITVQANIPNLTPPGDYHVGVYFDRDGARHESNRSNNFGMSASRPVRIAGWLLTTSALGDGEVNRDSTQRVFANGSRVSLNATAGKGAAFNGWLGDAFGTESQVTIFMDGDKDVQASFINHANLQVVIRGHGEVNGAGDGRSFPVGETATLQAIPGEGWEFTGWSGAAGGTESHVAVLMDAPKTITANFILPMTSWRAQHFTLSELQDPLISGDAADPNGNGMTNLQEYLHGSNPRDSNSRGTIRKSMDGGHLAIIFTRLVGAENGWVVSSEASRDLSEWNAPDLQERVLGIENGIETVEARLPNTGKANGFLRLKYNRSGEEE